jgi:anti-sigma B factor antagonist
VEFSVTSAERDSRTVVTVVGDLDVHTAPTLQQHLGPLTAVQGASLVIDLSAVSFIDSTGLGILVGALKHVREVGGRLDVVVTSPRVIKVFTLTGLDAVIALHPDLAGALAAG